MDKRYWYILIFFILIPFLKKINFNITDKPTPGLNAPEHKLVTVVKYILFAIGVALFIFTVIVLFNEYKDKIF